MSKPTKRRSVPSVCQFGTEGTELIRMGTFATRGNRTRWDLDWIRAVSAGCKQQAQASDSHGRWELRLISLHWNCEQVSYTAFGPDDARRARTGFELAAQAKNLYVDAAISDILVQMRGLQQVFAAERALWRVEKDNHQGVLTLGQRDGCRLDQ